VSSAPWYGSVLVACTPSAARGTRLGLNPRKATDVASTPTLCPLHEGTPLAKQGPSCKEFSSPISPRQRIAGQMTEVAIIR